MQNQWFPVNPQMLKKLSLVFNYLDSIVVQPSVRLIEVEMIIA